MLTTRRPVSYGRGNFVLRPRTTTIIGPSQFANHCPIKSAWRKCIISSMVLYDSHIWTVTSSFVTCFCFLYGCWYCRRACLCSRFLMRSYVLRWTWYYSASPSTEPGINCTVTTRVTFYEERRPNVYRVAKPVPTEKAPPLFASIFETAPCEYQISVHVYMFAKGSIVVN